MRHTENQQRSFFIGLFAAVVLIGTSLSACGGTAPMSTPTAVVETTATPESPATATPVPPTAEPEPATELDGTHWTLVSYVDDHGNTAGVLPDSTIDAEFTGGQILGTAGCNHYFTDTHIDGRSLTLGPVGSTRMSCGETLDNQEIAYLTALSSAAAYRGMGDQLLITDAEGTTMLTFARAEVTAEAPGAQAWTVDTLQNATYTLEDLGEVQLVDGKYEHHYGDGATMVDPVGVVNVALGDLNGDGNSDAAVILWWQSGGSGTFLYLAAMRNDDGAPRQAGILPLGDRVQPGEFSITGGTVTLEVLTHGPDDPMCCPSQKALQTYALEGDTLALIASETVSPELVGRIWMWERFDDAAGENSIVVDDPSRYTLEFLVDGTYSLRADCNQSSGGYTRDGNWARLYCEPV